MGIQARVFIPNAPEEVTPEWATSAMHAAGVLPSDAHVVDTKIDGQLGGVGMSGITKRIGFTYNRDDADFPKSVIAKFAAADTVIRGLVESLDIYGREIAFYRDLAERMPIRVPRFCGGGCDEASGQGVTEAAARVVNRLPPSAQLAITKDHTKFMRPSKRRYALMIEDLGDGHTVHDLTDPPTIEDLKSVLDQLALLHATFWGDASLAKHVSTRCMVTPTPRLYQNVFHGRGRGLMEERWPAGGWLTPHNWSVVERCVDRFADDLALLNKPVTLVHGDPRSDNVLYDSTGPTLVDWSLMGYANPAYDVGYLIGSSVRVEDMDRHAEALVRRYLRTLASHGRTVRFELLWQGVGAVARAVTVQNIMGLAYPLADYGEGGRAEDHWLPRLVALADTVGS